MLSVHIEADEDKGIEAYVNLFEKMKLIREEIEKSESNG